MGMASFLQFFARLDQDLEALLVHQGPLAYAILAAIIFCSVGVLPLFFLPADMLLFLAGALSAIGVLRPAWLAPLLVAAAIAGNVFNYALSRAVASVWKPSRVRWFDAAASRTRALYARHGAALLLFSPFIAIVRTGAPAIAGATAMPFRRFLRFVSGGAVIWIFSLALPGFFFGNVPWVRTHLPTAMAIVIGAGVVVVAVRALWSRRGGRAGGDPPLREHESRCD
ncbi:membrane-associated protein [Paraburkholderia caballeronis]|uniref:Membrane-associated protein n=2 Tax=Paraburkholderia caballeronis TaxID=416943 RepID=A0A1H7FUZ5_9BURK|nr:membrane-associated protein [Paraburkholderia caballeronis]PXX00564.1 membrane-associated protein [Paraburkholderia caballeronis]RAJ98627.1 membrane-associated protein [Paraburkholderia caballeronis]SEE68514.1 membrane-associated protein [Paraburkholderia caballeronis]SEK29634.1 membrane-associated protein [Paraburkholderia caballeronis]